MHQEARTPGVSWNWCFRLRKNHEADLQSLVVLLRADSRHRFLGAGKTVCPANSGCSDDPDRIQDDSDHGTAEASHGALCAGTDEPFLEAVIHPQGEEGLFVAEEILLGTAVGGS